MSTRHTLIGLGALGLALSFWLYTQADVVIMLSEQLWSCF
jgi:hypothetical protein